MRDETKAKLATTVLVIVSIVISAAVAYWFRQVIGVIV